MSGLPSAPSGGVTRLTRIVLNSADPERLSWFFIDALGFLPAEGAYRLRLGGTTLELRPVGRRGRPYPADVPGWSPLFQHCALITGDMTRSIARLTAWGGLAAISTAPQRLPAASGGVTAYKFRDPEGHPLEFIAPKPNGQPVTVRIDHSAISVSDTARSAAFYGSLGLKVGGQSLNVGIEQERLDRVPDAVVEVTALELPDGTAPHVELLRYRGDYNRAVPLSAPDDIAATRLVFAVANEATLARLASGAAALRDPDGHLLHFEVGG